MKAENKTSNFIGQYFSQYLKQTGFSRKILIKRLDLKYSNNDKAICDYLNKKDYLWWEYEVESWCKALNITNNIPVYAKLVEKAGRKKVIK